MAIYSSDRQRQQRRLRHLQRMSMCSSGTKPSSSLCAAIIFVDDTAAAEMQASAEAEEEEEAEPPRHTRHTRHTGPAGVAVAGETAPLHWAEKLAQRNQKLQQLGERSNAGEHDDAKDNNGSDEEEEDEEGEGAGVGVGVGEFHTTGAGLLLAEAVRTAGTDYHCPALEEQLHSLWSYAKAGRGAYAGERSDGTGDGWPLQTGDWWCTAHGNLQQCALTVPPPPPPPKKSKKAKRKQAKNKLKSKEEEEGGSLIVAPHLVFQVLVRGSDLRSRPISAIARISAAVRTIAAWCVRAGTVSDLMMPCSLPTSGAGLAMLHSSAAATSPFEVLNHFIDELKKCTEQQRRLQRQQQQQQQQQQAAAAGRGHSSRYGRCQCSVGGGLRRVVLLGGGGFPSREKEAEHYEECKAVGQRAAAKLLG